MNEILKPALWTAGLPLHLATTSYDSSNACQDIFLRAAYQIKFSPDFLPSRNGYGG